MCRDRLRKNASGDPSKHYDMNIVVLSMKYPKKFHESIDEGNIWASSLPRARPTSAPRIPDIIYIHDTSRLLLAVEDILRMDPSESQVSS